jgi:hypothetical protein
VIVELDLGEVLDFDPDGEGHHNGVAIDEALHVRHLIELLRLDENVNTDRIDVKEARSIANGAVDLVLGPVNALHIGAVRCAEYACDGTLLLNETVEGFWI